MAIAGVPASAHAQRAIQVSVTAATSPLRNGISHRASSTLSLDVVNNATSLALRHITFRLPNSYTIAASSAGPSGWTAQAVVRSGNYTELEFRADCSGTGLPAGGGRGTFLLNLTPPNDAQANDVTTEVVTISNGGDDYCSGLQYWTTNNPAFARRVLAVTGVAAPTGTLTGPASVAVTWTVANNSSASKTVTLENRTLAGLTASCTPANRSIASGRTATFACSYTGVPAGTYTFAASANAGANTTAIGSTVLFRVGAARVDWARPVAVAGRGAQTFTATFVNESTVAVTRVEVAAPAGWGAGSVVSGSGGLAAGTGCAAGAACFTGTLAAGGRATLQFRFASTPAVTVNTTYTFTTRATPAATSGAPVASFPQTVTLVAPLPDVSGLTILSDATGQTLSWTNTGRADAPHDGVVVFRAAAGTAPPFPQDFVDYTVLPRPATVIWADKGAATLRNLADGVTGAYNYRVCNHDANFVYSSCSSGFWNGAGYLDSARAPAGGWTHQLGGDALQFPTVLGGRAGIATNRPAMAVLDTGTGLRSFDPVLLNALPSSNAPATRLTNGRLALFAADQSGGITAVDLEAGTVLWRQTKANESFVAGVSGITRAYGHASFQASYPMDVLLLGSATTGNVLAVNALTGDTLWTVNTGSQVRALVTYDSNTNRFYVPGTGGVLAYDVTGSSPTVAARRLSGWTSPPGSYSLYCARTWENGSISCIDRTGVLRVIDGATGAVRASLATGVSSPTTLIRFAGSTPGFVIGSSTQVQRIAATARPYALTRAGTWSASGSTTVSSALVFSTSGFIFVASSDGSLQKLRLSDAGWLGRSAAVPAVVTGRLLGPINYDTTHRLFVFGTSEGRVWAIPMF